MTEDEIAQLRLLMAYEKQRTAPPAGFPALPDLPAGRYIDPRFENLEREHLWRKSWLLAGHRDELPTPGSFKLWEMSGQPIILMHARSGKINAFFNTCSHRGAPVVTSATGHRARLTCKYHGWAYDDEGRLVSIRDAEDFSDFDFSCRALRAVRCELYGKFIFVNFDPDAPSLAQWLGVIGDELTEFQFENARLVDHYVWELDCNWKIAMEANMEVYHVPNIHPSTVALALDHRRNVNTLFPGGHSRMVAPGWDNTRASYIADGARPEFETVGEIARTCTQSYSIVPNLVSPPGATGTFILAFWPNGIAKSRLEVWWIGPDWGDAERPAYWDQTIAFLNSVLEEDTQFGAWIQKAQNSYGFRGVPLSYQEARIYHWHQAVDQLIGSERIPPELRVAPVIGSDWIHPNDPRIGQAQAVLASPA